MSITSQDLLQRAQERTGLARNQLLLMVAKSAAVRHIAQGPHSEHFVLKGGTLLTHVYSSPRQSIQDADYLHRQAETVTGPELEQALLGDAKGITFDPAFSFDAGQEHHLIPSHPSTFPIHIPVHVPPRECDRRLLHEGDERASLMG